MNTQKSATSLRKIFSYITPLTLLAVFSVFLCLYGLAHMGGHENYEVALLIIGLPLLIFSLLFHFGTRWLFHKKNLPIWITELILIVVVFLFFYFNH